MILYAYDRESGEYLGPVRCQIDPEGSRLAGTTLYLRPANAVDEPPKGDAPEGFVHAWRGGGWALVEDHRGATVWDKATGRAVVIRSLGPLPDELTTIEPAAEPERRRVARIDIVRRLAAVGLLAAAEKAIAGADALTRQEWATADLGVYADDPKTIGFLRLIGADPDVILAP